MSDAATTKHGEQSATVRLEEKCPRCKDEYPDKGWCEECKELGYVPTRLGRDLLIFLDRHGFVQARERR